MGPQSAIISLFRTHPFRDWSPPDLRDGLIQLISIGRVSSKTTNPLSATHTALQELVKQGLVEKRSKKYRLIQKEAAPLATNEKGASSA